MTNVANFPNRRGLNPSRLKDARLAAGLNQSELAAAVNVSRQAISSFEQGEKNPELDTLVRIAEKLKQPLSFFSAEDPPVFGTSSSLFLRATGPATKRRNMTCTVLSKWFAQTAKYLDSYVNFPKVQIPKIEPSSANGRYDAEEIEVAAEACRDNWKLGLGPIADLLSLLEAHGIAVCRCAIEREDRLDAFSFWSGNRPFVVLASEKESSARSRFDAAHELGHLILHRWIGLDELEDSAKLKQIEREADRFASAFLLPRKSFPNEVFSSRLDSFVALKKRWRVSIQAMVYRCKQLGIFDDDQSTNLYKQISARRWKTSEPLDNVEAMPLEQPRLLRTAIALVVDNGRKVADQIVVDLQLKGSLIAEFCNLPLDYFAAHKLAGYAPSLK